MPLHQITKNQKIYIEYAPHHLGAKKRTTNISVINSFLQQTTKCDGGYQGTAPIAM